jgi:acyl-CoA thioester hydrolase
VSERRPEAPGRGGVSEIEHRVTYAETDQMGVVYHAHYLVWCEMARTEHLRRLGMTYRDLEAGGTYLAVAEARVRYHAPARYDDVVRVRCWVRDAGSRGVRFAYEIAPSGGGPIQATAETLLIALNRARAVTRIPEHVRELLEVGPDPARR